MVSLVTFLSFSLFLSILAELSVVLMKEWVMWVLAWRWSLSYICQLSGGLASGQAHLDHKGCYRQSVSFMLRWHIDVTKVQCIHTYAHTDYTHTHAHTPPILLLTLTDWCLPVSQGVGVRTILCNWIPVATVYLPPSSSLWQQSLTYSQSLLKSICFLHVFGFLSKSPFYMLLSTCLLSNPLFSFSLKSSVLPVHAFHRFQRIEHRGVQRLGWVTVFKSLWSFILCNFWVQYTNIQIVICLFACLYPLPVYPLCTDWHLNQSISSMPHRFSLFSCTFDWHVILKRCSHRLGTLDWTRLRDPSRSCVWRKTGSLVLVYL